MSRIGLPVASSCCRLACGRRATASRSTIGPGSVSRCCRGSPFYLSLSGRELPQVAQDCGPHRAKSQALALELQSAFQGSEYPCLVFFSQLRELETHSFCERAFVGRKFRIDAIEDV